MHRRIKRLNILLTSVEYSVFNDNHQFSHGISFKFWKCQTVDVLFFMHICVVYFVKMNSSECLGCHEKFDAKILCKNWLFPTSFVERYFQRRSVKFLNFFSSVCEFKYIICM